VKPPYSIGLALPALLGGVSAMAADMTVKLDIPQLNVAEYHRPYVAVWLERPDQSVAATLSVLYEVRKRDNGGAKYLKDLRTWWRKAGRDLTMPMDGVSGATRAPGEALLTFPGAKPALDKLPAGDYTVVVEAAREAGGREVVRIPVQWPPKAAQSYSAKGKEELGAVTVQVKP